VSSRRIKSLRDPAVKMSKSDPDRRSAILLTDSADLVQEKVRKAVTDMIPSISYDPLLRPGVSNLVDIASAFMGRTVDEVCRDCRCLDTVGFKNHVSDLVIERLRPIREEIGRLLGDRSYLSSVIVEGSEKATELAESTYREVKRRVGLDTSTDALDLLSAPLAAASGGTDS